MITRLRIREESISNFFALPQVHISTMEGFCILSSGKHSNEAIRPVKLSLSAFRRCVATNTLFIARGGIREMDGLGQLSAAFSGPKKRSLSPKAFGNSDRYKAV